MSNTFELGNHIGMASPSTSSRTRMMISLDFSTLRGNPTVSYQLRILNKLRNQLMKQRYSKPKWFYQTNTILMRGQHTPCLHWLVILEVSTERFSSFSIFWWSYTASCYSTPNSSKRSQFANPRVRLIAKVTRASKTCPELLMIKTQWFCSKMSRLRKTLTKALSLPFFAATPKSFARKIATIVFARRLKRG